MKTLDFPKDSLPKCIAKLKLLIDQPPLTLPELALRLGYNTIYNGAARALIASLRSWQLLSSTNQLLPTLLINPLTEEIRDLFLEELNRRILLPALFNAFSAHFPPTKLPPTPALEEFSIHLGASSFNAHVAATSYWESLAYIKSFDNNFFKKQTFTINDVSVTFPTSITYPELESILNSILRKITLTI